MLRLRDGETGLVQMSLSENVDTRLRYIFGNANLPVPALSNLPYIR